MSKPNEITVKMIDVLPDCIEGACDIIAETLQEYFNENCEDSTLFPDWSDVDYNGGLHETIDSAVPIYYGEIRDAWYLHEDRIVEAYENMGIGDNPKENDGMAALFCYIEQECQEWWHNNAEDLWDKWTEEYEAEQEAKEKATGGENK